MRRTSLLATLAVTAIALTVGCRENPIAPPSGLSVTLSVTNASAPFPPPTVQATEDSIIATYVSGVSGCDDYHADAGLRSGTMVITITAVSAPDRMCFAVLASATYRAVVHGAPAGRYPVVVASRRMQSDGKSSPSSEIVRQVVTLP